MAMMACGECGSAVSSEARSCPGCGVDRKIFRRAAGDHKRVSLPKKLGIGFAVLVGVGVLTQGSAPPAINAAAAADDPAVKQEKARDYAAYLSARALKASLRNPESLTFKSIRASDDGSVICMTYRAQNGFGGLNLEHMLVKDGDPTQGAAAWNRNCAHKMLFDVTGVGRLIH
ncbi:hypothetical protein [Sphingomonas sp. RB1R13]|uniref:hypothetical protein n=1 Tax=Sphingomonas sp. RB1R13 TaxID=3096159 RepID=UPI002FC8E056